MTASLATMAGRAGPVLVIDGTGQQGGAAARAALKGGWTVRALVRDVNTPAARQLRDAGASLVTGDLDDLESVRAAMRSAHGVFLALTMMTGPRVTLEGVAAEQRRGRPVAELAREAGSRTWCTARSTALTGIPASRMWRARPGSKNTSRALALPATSSGRCRSATTSPPVLDGGELVISLALRPQTRLPLVATRDIGVFAAIAFDQPGRFTGRHVEIAGDCLSGPQIAEVFGRTCGVPARFRQLPTGQLRASGEEVAKMFEWMDSRAAGQPDIAAVCADHPGLMTLEAWLRAAGWRPQPAAGGSRQEREAQ